MYLSRLTLDTRNGQVRRDLANRYELHATLCWAFEDHDQAHPLWRMELTRPGEAPCLLVQSLAAPDWGRLAGRHTGYFLDQISKALDLPEQVRAGQRLRFRLEANPTITRDGKRHGLWQEDEQLAWLNRQGERGGFAIESAVVTRQDRLDIQKHGRKQRIILYAVLFDGYLFVRDPTSFGQTLRTGIGHGKALGLGLLSIGSG
jgi:CRISPR system Cascade subunit CasE